MRNCHLASYTTKRQWGLKLTRLSRQLEALLYFIGWTFFFRFSSKSHTQRMNATLIKTLRDRFQVLLDGKRFPQPQQVMASFTNDRTELIAFSGCLGHNGVNDGLRIVQLAGVIHHREKFIHKPVVNLDFLFFVPADVILEIVSGRTALLNEAKLDI